MSTDKKSPFDPQAELNFVSRAQPSSRRWLTIWLPGLGILLLWAFLCRGCIRNDGENFYDFSSGAIAAADGSSNHGSGSGSGDSGTGPGAGEKGSGAGRTLAQAASGTGSTSGQPGNALPGSGTERRDGSPGAVNRPRPVVMTGKIESISRPRKTPSVRQAAPSTGGTVAGRKGFYGVESSSKSKSIFIVDVSGSMAGSSSEYPGKNRLEVMKMELRKALFKGQTLSEASYNRSGGFMIIAFSDQIRCFPQQKLCRYRNRSTMKDAEKFIEQQLQPGGGTIMKPAWNMAVSCAISESADEIFFLTDGESQDNLTYQWLKNCFNALSGKVKVHCIALGVNQDFMKKAATERRGQYIYIP